MNWRISKTVAVLSLSSFLFSACEDPTAIGLELQEPGTQIGTLYTDSATITASTVLLRDSIIGLSAPRTQVGKVTDGPFGTVSARTYAEFAPLTFPAHPDSIDATRGADSLVINLDYNTAYGDTTKQLTLNIHRLTEGFRDADTYYTTRNLAHNQTPVGSVTFLPRPSSTIPGATDATQKTPVLLKVKITGAFANEVLQTLAQTSSMATFLTALKGLVIAPAEGQAGEGSILGILPTAASSNLTLYYKSKKNIAKTTTLLFTDRYFNQIEANRADTPLVAFGPSVFNGTALSSEATGNRTYLQAGTGLVTKIELPYLTNFRKNAAGQTQDLAINKAELIIPVDASTVLTPAQALRLPPVITVVQATRSNRMALTNGVPNALQAQDGAQPAMLQYRGEKGGYVYVVNITNYVQNLLYNITPNNGLILLPSNVTSSASIPTNFAQTVNRAVLEANQKGTGADRRITLRLFYSTAQ
jgi:hypothetical protein